METRSLARPSEYYVTPKINCSLLNLYQGFRNIYDILLLTNILNSQMLVSSGAVIDDNHHLTDVRLDEGM